MSTESPFELSRATIDDMPELVSLLARSFPEDVSTLFLGSTAAECLPRLTESMQKEMREERSMIWLKVVDKSTGKIVAGSEWRINVSLPPEHPDLWPVPWLEGDLKEKSMRMHKGMNAARAAAMKEPFVYLHICFTDADYRRRGAGALMMQWGVDLADMLFLPAWIEASEDGNYLYRTFGFYDYKKEIFEGMTFLNMKRDAKTAAIEGGR